MPDEATTKWQSVLEILSDSTELSTGKLSIIRMTRVIDVDGTLVLVAGSPFTKSKVEEARAIISRALTRVWGSEVPFEVIVDTSLDAGAPAPAIAVARPPAQHLPPQAPDLSSALAEADALCARQGLRLTALRRRVLELVWQSHKPLGAYDILAVLSEQDGRRAAPPPGRW